jgi:hypothetical protein
MLHFHATFYSAIVKCKISADFAWPSCCYFAWPSCCYFASSTERGLNKCRFIITLNFRRHSFIWIGTNPTRHFTSRLAEWHPAITECLQKICSVHPSFFLLHFQFLLHRKVSINTVKRQDDGPHHHKTTQRKSYKYLYSGQNSNLSSHCASCFKRRGHTGYTCAAKCTITLAGIKTKSAWVKEGTIRTNVPLKLLCRYVTARQLCSLLTSGIHAPAENSNAMGY